MNRAKMKSSAIGVLILGVLVLGAAGYAVAKWFGSSSTSSTSSTGVSSSTVPGAIMNTTAAALGTAYESAGNFLNEIEARARAVLGGES